jgi:hypothetical protein
MFPLDGPVEPEVLTSRERDDSRARDECLEAAKRDEHAPTDSQTEALAARLAGIREQLEAIESALRDRSQEGRELDRQRHEHRAGEDDECPGGQTEFDRELA